jgi:hypothetical protein
MAALVPLDGCFVCAKVLGGRPYKIPTMLRSGAFFWVRPVAQRVLTSTSEDILWIREEWLGTHGHLRWGS